MHSQKGSTSVIILTVIIVLAGIVFFFPKRSGSGGTCLGCQIKSCQCLGVEKDYHMIGPVKVTCYGIPHSCMVQDAVQANTNTSTNTNSAAVANINRTAVNVNTEPRSCTTNAECAGFCGGDPCLGSNCSTAGTCECLGLCGVQSPEN